jgi:pilus assembly protein CpaC
VRFGNVQIPGLTVRRASTTVELKDGQSFAIAGLLQSLNNTTLAQLPWIGDVPILGALFRSTSFQRRETDLVIIVTPRLIQPTPAGVALRTPLDGSRRGNDADIFLSGRAEVPVAAIRSADTAQRGIRRTGHIIDLTPGGNRATR